MNMIEILKLVIRTSVLVFVVGSMFALGMSLTIKQIVDPLRNPKRVILALLANFLLVPVVTYGILQTIPVDEGVRIALVLLAVAAGAPFLPKLGQVSKGDIAFSVGLMLLLMVGTIVYMPLVLPFMLEEVNVDAVKIAQSLVTMMLIPLAIGLGLRAWAAGFSGKVTPWIVKLSNLALVVLVVLLVVLNIKEILSMMVTGDGLAILVFIVASLVCGFALGGKKAPIRNVMGLGTGQRNISAALIVAGQNFKDPQVLVTLVVTAIVGLLVFMPLAAWLGRHSPRGNIS